MAGPRLPASPLRRELASSPRTTPSVLRVARPALSPTLIASELSSIGAALHRRRPGSCGWLEVFQPLGAVFRDDIASSTGAAVKLLRLRSADLSGGRTRDRGSKQDIAATTDRAVRSRPVAPRGPLLRLCSTDRTPSSRGQLGRLREAGSARSVRAGGLAGEPRRQPGPRERALDRRPLGGLSLAGNFRGDEQCVRKDYPGEYRPLACTRRPASACPTSSRRFTGSEEVLRRYCTLVYAQTGSTKTGRGSARPPHRCARRSSRPLAERRVD